jgi:hypothetical protein
VRQIADQLVGCAAVAGDLCGGQHARGGDGELLDLDVPVAFLGGPRARDLDREHPLCVRQIAQAHPAARLGAALELGVLGQVRDHVLAVHQFDAALAQQELDCIPHAIVEQLALRRAGVADKGESIEREPWRRGGGRGADCAHQNH